MAHLEPVSRPVLGRLDEEDPGHIWEANEIIAASDGSVDPLTGAAAYNWRITTHQKKGLITRSCRLFTDSDCMDSFQAELAGLNDLVLWIKESGLHRKRTRIVCDSKSCVDLLQTTETNLTDLDRAQGEILQSTRNTLKEYTDVSIEWVAGHQDDTTPYEELPLLVQLNIDCDQAAKKCMRNNPAPLGRQPRPIGSKASLYLDNKLVTVNISKRIQMAAQGPKIRRYIQEKFD